MCRILAKDRLKERWETYETDNFNRENYSPGKKGRENAALKVEL